MATDWKSQLISSLRPVETASADGAQRTQALEGAYSQLVDAVGSAVGEIASAAGLGVSVWGAKADGRVRWIFAGRQLAVYLDRGAGRCVVTCDLGRELRMQDISPTDSGELIDSDGRPQVLEEVCERFVTLLFRAPG